MRIIVFLAQGFEEIEALTVVDYLRRVDVKVDMVSISDDLKVTGSHGISVLGDMTISDIEDTGQYQGLVIPGGLPGATNLRDNPFVIDLVKKFMSQKKLVAAICAGPIVLERAGVLKGKKVTSYPGFEGKLAGAIYREEKVVTDGNLITSRGPSLAVYFAIEIVKYLLGEDKAEELKDAILLNLMEGR